MLAKKPGIFVISLLLILTAGRGMLPAQDTPVVRDIPFLSAVIIDSDSLISGDLISETVAHNGKELGFRSYEHNLAFRVEPSGINEYRFFLDGFDRKYTKWNNSGFKEYTNLPSGEFTLHISFRDSRGREGELPPLSFSIKPAWYQSKPARIAWLTLLVLSMWLFYRIFILKLRKEKRSMEAIISKKNEDLRLEREKTGKLLENVMPKGTASELMEKGRAAKIKYNFVTVLFSDIQGFTQIAEEMNPELLIDELDKFFFHFDTVVEKYGIEKIKTIGDAYMCAGGIPERNRTNPVEVILAALEMQEYMARLKTSALAEGMKFWDIRIGIHTGTVVAGVIGHKKLSYDIWGDTVNTASRMESAGEGGKINISGTTYEFVKDFFECSHRGKMPVKYKGEIDMYFVKGIAENLKDENGLPNSMFRSKMQLIRLPDVEEKVDKIFTDEAPPNLYFHNGALARNITSQVDLISNAEQLSDEDYLGLKLASIFLVSGYITDYEKPAEAALELIDAVLPSMGFEEKYTDAAKNLVRNSFGCRYPELADRILHDARYDYLGRVDFRKQADRLLKERREHGLAVDTDEWNRSQEVLLREHDFLTGTGRLLRSVSLEAQIDSLTGKGA